MVEAAHQRAVDEQAVGSHGLSAYTVIASEAKQSMTPQARMDCFVACAPRNDGGGITPPPPHR
jgi:hypothetical protein